MCEGLGRALAPRAARDGSGRHQRGFPRAGPAGTAVRAASAASAAKARGFSCPRTKYAGATSTRIVSKSEGVLLAGPRGYRKRAATSTASLGAGDSGVFTQIHAAKMFTSLPCCSFPLFTTLGQLKAIKIKPRTIARLARASLRSWRFAAVETRLPRRWGAGKRKGNEMIPTRPPSPIPGEGGSRCVPGSERRAQRRAAPPREPGCNFPSKASAQPRPHRHHSRFWAHNRIICRVCRSFWRVHSISFTEPLLRAASAGREKMTQKSW